MIVGSLVPGDHRVAVVAARFNDLIVDHMLAAAREAWAQLGGEPQKLVVARVPGSFELPVAAKKLAEAGDAGGSFAAVICLGCVIRGETDHYDHVVEQTAKGIKDVGVQTGIPCVFGVLTCDTLEQALHRAGVKLGNAGRNAVHVAVEMANLVDAIEKNAAAPAVPAPASEAGAGAGAASADR